ncbi:hypothetical protein WJX75_000611 [Coccomyxa subellipsoidea]|uniref:SS18 N-terminal domain-containing protein n=1 Tax=Coccomyxa subellipsoidea TaxID=248742 RepID=A0ABR2YMH1_9CHLO
MPNHSPPQGLLQLEGDLRRMTGGLFTNTNYWRAHMQAQAPPNLQLKPPTLIPGGLNVQTPTTEIVQQYLEDNERLIRYILECINAGRVEEAVTQQQRLQQNLMWLAGIADSQAPPTPSASAPAQGSAMQPGPGQAAVAASGQQVVQAASAKAETVAEAAAQQAIAQEARAAAAAAAAASPQQPPAT